MNRPFLFVLALLLAQAAAGAGMPPRPEGVIPVDGQPAPTLRLPDMEGNTVDLREMRGQWVFVHFWASWCGPCRRELPAIARLAEQMKGTDLKLVLINTAEDEDTIWTFLAAVAPTLDTLRDRNGLTTEAWEPRGLPATYLVDPQGRIQYQGLGGRPWDKEPYLSFLRRLVGRPGNGD